MNNESAKSINGFGFAVPAERIGNTVIVNNPQVTSPFITGGAAKPPRTVTQAQVVLGANKGVQIIEQRKRQPKTSRRQLP
jgi:hypothetical protein